MSFRAVTSQDNRGATTTQDLLGVQGQQSITQHPTHNTATKGLVWRHANTAVPAMAPASAVAAPPGPLGFPAASRPPSSRLYRSKADSSIALLGIVRRMSAHRGARVSSAFWCSCSTAACWKQAAAQLVYSTPTVLTPIVWPRCAAHQLHCRRRRQTRRRAPTSAAQCPARGPARKARI